MLSEQVTPARQADAQASASHEREFQAWAKTMGIPPARLKQAVSAVGITPRKIREYLRKNQ